MGTEVLRRRWERRRRVEERAEVAAQKVLDVLEQARKLFDGFTEIGTGPEDERVYDLCHALEREALLLPDPEVRSRLGELSEVLWYAQYFVARQVGHSPHQIAFTVYKAGSEVIGAFLRDERLDSTSQFQSTIATYHLAATAAASNLERFIGGTPDEGDSR